MSDLEHEIDVVDAVELPKNASRLAASSAMFMASFAFGNIGYFASVFLLAHWFVPADRAVVAFGTLSVLLLARLSRLGVPEATSVQAASHPETRSSLLANQLWFSTITATMLGAFFVVALRVSGSHPGGISSTTTIVVGVGTLLYALYDTLGVYLVSSGRGKVFALTYPMEGWGWLIFIVATRELERLNPGRAVTAWVVAFSCGAVFRLVTAIRVAGIARPSFTQTRALVIFGFPAWIGAMSTIVSYRLDQVLMGFISTRTQLGLYAVAVNGSEVLLYIAMATSMALTPAIARSAPEEIAPRALQAFRIVTLLTVGSTLIGLALGPWLLPFVFGHRYHGSVPSFLVLAAGAVGWTTSVVLSSALLGARASRLSSIGSVAALLVGIALDIALIPPYGAIGAAIATTSGFVAAGIASAIAFSVRFDTPTREFVPGRADLAELAGFGRNALTAVSKRRGIAT
jgi:O-antigen/teichoic acid export membrane protein